ncbi:MAG: class I SAM-dependent methyltransferase [Deltaproteobacteria bacterium]|nr:class I SAM-dependent methyltransferase [Deltaproteobacteria bacterium]
MKSVRRKYNILAGLYDRIWPGYIRKTVAAAMEPLRLQGGETLLDIGCGTGALEKTLVEKWPSLKIVGVDISDDMLRRAQKKMAAFPDIVFKQGDFVETPLEKNCFDIAFSLSNFHYFANPEAVLQKVASLLKPGGLFILVDWNRDSFQGKLYNWYMDKADPSFVKSYTLNEMKTLLEKAGFRLQNNHFFKVGLRWRMMQIVSQKP